MSTDRLLEVAQAILLKRIESDATAASYTSTVSSVMYEEDKLGIVKDADKAVVELCVAQARELINAVYPVMTLDDTDPFWKVVKHVQKDGVYKFSCPKGEWSTACIEYDVAVRDAKHYFMQYVQDGIYDDILSGEEE